MTGPRTRDRKYDYEDVASIYAHAELFGHAPTRAVQEALSVNYTTAAAVVKRARNAGAIPPRAPRCSCRCPVHCPPTDGGI